MEYGLDKGDVVDDADGEDEEDEEDKEDKGEWCCCILVRLGQFEIYRGCGRGCGRRPRYGTSSLGLKMWCQQMPIALWVQPVT
jgi:hypothetical protein